MCARETTGSILLRAVGHGKSAWILASRKKKGQSRFQNTWTVEIVLSLPKWAFSLSLTHNCPFHDSGTVTSGFFERGEGILNTSWPASLLSCTIHLKRPSSAREPWVSFKEESRGSAVHCCAKGVVGGESGAQAPLFPPAARYSSSEELHILSPVSEQWMNEGRPPTPYIYMHSVFSYDCTHILK